MNQPQLLRRLQQAAHDRDERALGETLAELDRNEGWSDDVDAFIDRQLSGRERSFVDTFRGPPEGDEDGTFVGGGGNGQSGGVASTPVVAVNPFAGITKDATSGIYVPATSGEWSTLISAAGLSIAVPDALWLMQEASGNLADSIGAFTLTASGTGATYQSAVTGWSRTGIAVTDGATAAFTSTSASLPDISTTSMFTVLFATVTGTPAANRIMATQGTTTSDALKVASTPRLRATSGANFADGAATPVGGVRPYGLRTNRTAASATGFSDVDKLIPTWTTTVTGKQIIFSSSPPPMAMVYGFQWHAANAEISDANFKAMLQAMGFTVTWV